MSGASCPSQPPGESSLGMLQATLNFEALLFGYTFLGKPYSAPTPFDGDVNAKDMLDNLRNVCVPNTGVRLSLFCWHWTLAYLFISVIYPAICFIAAWMVAVDNEYENDRDGVTSNSVRTLSFLGRLRTSYVDYLLHPRDWFSLWRLNCNLIAYHSYITKSKDYRQEDKWTFLYEGEKLGCPVSPFMNVRSIVCKNKLIEGGMGIHFFKNARYGGDWIIQEALDNVNWLKELLPQVAPLSTMRVVTASSYSLGDRFSNKNSNKNNSNDSDSNDNNMNESINSKYSSSVADKASTSFEPCSEHSGDGPCAVCLAREQREKVLEQQEKGVARDIHPSRRGKTNTATADDFLPCVEPLSCVLRLGRAGAATDHQSILYNVLMDKREADCTGCTGGDSSFSSSSSRAGLISHGSVNSQWYQLGWRQFLWLPVFLFKALVVRTYKYIFESNINPARATNITSFDRHPDAPSPLVVGKRVPSDEYAKAIDIVKTWHYRMMPEVPLVGWDVAFTDRGIFLLEVNLSCNFFQGHLDFDSYYALINRFFVDLEVPRARVVRDDN